MSLSIKKRFTVDTSPERIWEIMIDDFEDVAEWVSGLDSSGSNHEAAPLADGTVGGRVCEIPGFGFTDERIVTYEPAAKTFAYSVEAEKIPSFVKNLTNTWKLTPVGSSTQIDMHLTADVGGPLGAIMKPMMTRKFNKTLADIETDLVAYAETGRVSEKKARELTKRASKVAA